MSLPPSGMNFIEYYLYSQKAWDIVPSGVKTFVLSYPVLQNAPVIVTSSGYETTTATDPWAQVDGSGKWTKRGYGEFAVSPAGVYDTTYKEFTLNPEADGKVEFNQTLDEIVYIEYEAYPSGYYDVDSININPIMRETESGFLHITSVESPAYLSLKATQSVLKSDGFHRSNLSAVLYDQNFNRIYNKKIIFEMLFNLGDGSSGPNTDIGYLMPGKLDGEPYGIHPSGFVYKTSAYTDKFGQASAEVTTFGHRDGRMAFKAYYTEASGIYDTTEIIAYRWHSNQFILDYSMLDSLDFLDDVAWTPLGIPGDEPEG